MLPLVIVVVVVVPRAVSLGAILHAEELPWSVRQSVSQSNRKFGMVRPFVRAGAGEMGRQANGMLQF